MFTIYTFNVQHVIIIHIFILINNNRRLCYTDYIANKDKDNINLNSTNVKVNTNIVDINLNIDLYKIFNRTIINRQTVNLNKNLRKTFICSLIEG